METLDIILIAAVMGGILYILLDKLEVISSNSKALDILDNLMAPFGVELEPADKVLAEIEKGIDGPDDFLIKALAAALDKEPSEVVEILHPIVQQARTLTDGE